LGCAIGLFASSSLVNRRRVTVAAHRADNVCSCTHASTWQTARDAQQQPNDNQVHVAVDTFRLLADATRLRLLWALSKGAELDVTSLSRIAGVARPATSQHLARLRLAGLVDTRREGRQVYYRIRGVHLRRVISEALFHADHTISGAEPHD